MENISIAFKNALADEKLIQREVASDLNTHHGNLSNVKNPAQWSKVPEQVWQDLNEWKQSGEKLKGYIPVRLRGKQEEPQPEPAEKSIYDKLEEQHKQVAERRKAKKESKEPEEKPEAEKKPEKEPSVTKGAKKFLKGKKPGRHSSGEPEPKEEKKPDTGNEKPNGKEVHSMDDLVKVLDGALVIEKIGPEENVISKKFGIEVEVKLRLREEK